jgi:ComEC/Rec2-related protein
VWCYAFVAGLKSGVLRSAIMVSVFTLGYYNDRGANLLNTLIVAAFAALIANPYFVFDTGFQLSYLAVWGIVVFFPLLKAAIRINIPIVKYFLELTFVGICAQIAVFPVLLKSFGVFSFSGVFFGSLVVSAGTIVLYSSVFLLILSPITKLFQFGIGLLDKMMDLFHLMLSKIGSFDVLIIKDIPVRNYQVFFLIFIIVILSRVLNNLNPKGIIRLGVVLSLFFMSIVFEDLRVMNQGQKLCFYNSRDYELHTGFITQSRNIIYAADSLSENMMQVFENHLLSNNIREQREGLTGCVDSDLVIKADKVLKNSILSCFGSKYVLFFKDRSPYIRPLNKMHIDYIFCKYLSDYTYRYLKENYIFEKIVCYLDYRQKDGSESDVEMHVSRDVHCLKDEGAFIVCLDERVK